MTSLLRIDRSPAPAAGQTRQTRRVRLTVVLATLLTLAVSAYSFRVERDEADRRERDLSRQAVAATNVLLTRTISGLEGARGLVDELGFVDPDGFQAFARELAGAPGLTAVALERVVTGDQRELFEVEVGRPIRDYVAPGRFEPAPERAAHVAIERVVPSTPATEALIGLDLLSEPATERAAQAALAGGRTVITQPHRLSLSGEIGFLVVTPLYRRFAPVSTPVERQRAAAALVSATYVGEALGRAVVAQLPAGTELRISDDTRTVAGPQRLPSDATEADLLAGGRSWRIATKGSQGASLLPPLGLLVGGLALTGLLGLLFYEADRREQLLDEARRRIERAQRRTAALQAATSALSGAATAADVMAVAFDEALPLLGASGATVSLLTADGATLELARATGIPQRDEERFASVPVDGPFAMCEAVREREPVFLGDRIDWRERFPDSEAGADPNHQALAAMPLLEGGRAVGVLVLLFRESQQFPDDDRAFMVAVSRQIAQALERSRLSDAEHQLAVSLQEGLLPRHLPELPGIEVATRYRPSLERVNLGGDWYDAIELPEGRLGVAVGDVVGHGPQAAAVMGQMRSALRAFAMEHEPPEDVVEALSRFAEGIPEALGTTLVYGVLDARAQELRYACAGHPPPLVLRPGAEPEFVDLGRSPPLGVGLTTFQSFTIELEPNAIVLLYSDGAFERRGEPYDTGLGRLLSAAAAARRDSVEQLCSGLLDSLFADYDPQDDVALLAVAIVPGAMRELELDAAARPEQLAPLRGQLRSWLVGSGVPGDVANDVVLASSEALTNAVEHAYGPLARGNVFLEARISASGELVVVVRDHGAWLRGPAGKEHRGRGLQVMRTVMDHVEVERRPGGTTVTMRRRLAVPH
jgi:serine phosphatase RsbU (regulator of sigma subunit)/anti-sigma regulatory factor (Ser/Thr protein kinase)/CHASE1-domain containing sensor protein